MTRRHSTRLSQVHDEPEDDRGQHTAARDYPELGSILTDRPDPGQQITVIGSKTAADSYGGSEDPRDGDFAGEPGSTGMHWGEPAQQAWVHENLGPQEAAPPPVYGPDTFAGNVMARLHMLEEADRLMGGTPAQHAEMRRRATAINGTQIDGAGDAPAHGTVPRAAEPNSYDGRSTEGQGDPKWDDPLPSVNKQDANGATVGMYPEGISSGSGPGISVGPVVAVAEWEAHSELMNVHGHMVTRDGLIRHMQESHGMPPGHPLEAEGDRSLRMVHTVRHSRGDRHADELPADYYDFTPPHEPEATISPSEYDADEGTAAHYHAHEGPIDPVFGARTASMSREEFAGLRRHVREDHYFPVRDSYGPGALAAIHNGLHMSGLSDHDHGDDYETDPGWEDRDTAGGYHQFTASRREARVPWTGKERGTLHRWQEEPTATWGDFVPSTEFPLSGPGGHAGHEDHGEGIGLVEGTSDRQWEEHLRRDHGWDDQQLTRAYYSRGKLRDVHEALHGAGLAGHRHAGGPEEARDEARNQSLVNMFGRDIADNGPAMTTLDGYPLAAPERGGASGGDPMIGIIQSREARPPRHPDYWEQADPGKFRRMMSALNVHVRIDGKELSQPHEHDDAANSLDHDEDSPQDNPQDKNGPETASPQADDADSLDSPADFPQDSPQDGQQGFGDPGQWPQAGADVTETGRAYTQGSDDGKVKRGAPSGAPGTDGEDEEDDGDKPDDDSTPFSKDGALAMFTAAAASPSYRFHFTAAWSDVVAKAKRIRAEGHVQIVHASAGMVIGEVRGDHDTYECGIQRPVGKRLTIQHWACGCPWASFHQKTARRSFNGRPCSHVMALQFEAQARGMFGRTVRTDAGVPSWAPDTVVVKSWPPYEGEPHAGRWREEWRAPLARRRGALQSDGALHWPFFPRARGQRLTDHLEAHHGISAPMIEGARGRGDFGATAQDIHRRMHERAERGSPERQMSVLHQHDEPHGIPAERQYPDMFRPYWFDEAGQQGGSQPDGWEDKGGLGDRDWGGGLPPSLNSLRHGAPAQHATAVLLRAGEDPQEVGALRALAGLGPYRADQANGAWGGENVSRTPPQKPYGATSPPNRDQDPGSYGTLAGPDPDNWGSIQEDSAIQMPLSNTASHGAPHPVPGDVLWPDMNGWQAQDQGSFGYSDRANTAGPYTAMNPADPNGIRMEEVRRTAVVEPTEDDYRQHLMQGHSIDPGTVGAEFASSLDDMHRLHHIDHPDLSHVHGPGQPFEGWDLPNGLQPRERGDMRGALLDLPQDEWNGEHMIATPVQHSDPGFRDRGRFHTLSELRDRPEPALPETTGDDQAEGEDLRERDEIDGTMGDAQDVPHLFSASRLHSGCSECGLSRDSRVHMAAADGTIGGGDAGTGSGQGAPLDEAALDEFTASTPMGDLARETWPQAQQPSPVTQQPGMGSMDDGLGPDGTSIQTTGTQQWSGGGTDDGPGAVPAGEPQGSIDDIVAAFQRSAAAKGYTAGGAPKGDSDIATAARRYLSKTADVLPKDEADALIREGAGSRARNLDLLRLEGTHYEDQDDDLGKRGISLDDYDDDVVCG